VVEKFGVGPERVVDVQALAGDSTDNVPGVPGIGVKTAVQLIGDYGDLDSLLARAAEIKQPKRRQTLIDHAEMARVSRELVRLRDDVEVPLALHELVVQPPSDDILLDFFKAQSFKRLIARLEGEMVQGNGDPTGGEGAELAPAETAYELVQEMADLHLWIDEARQLGVVAVDTETSSLNAMRAALIGVSLATRAGRACYIPLAHRAPQTQGDLDLAGPAAADGPKQIPFAAATAALKDLLEDPAVLKIGHNIKYDALVLAQPANGGITVAPVDDTMCLSYVLEAGAHGHGLDELSLMHVDHRNIKFEEVCGKGKAQIPFAEVPLETARDYAAEDA
ncbi:MAG: 5'-3' exonuclease H3TH domain-containing protein, partial [Thalassobaculaceae bacterium]